MLSIIYRLLEKIGYPRLPEALSDEVTGSELNSILLEVFDRRVRKLSAPELLKLYHGNRFVKPADLPVMKTRQTEMDVLNIFLNAGFQPLDLSPVSVLGACSVLGPVDQKKVLSALRGTEVVADATNAIALHYSDMRKNSRRISDNDTEPYRASCIQRHVRAQGISGKGFTPHFRIGCLVTCGLDTGNYSFETASMASHIGVMIDLYRGYHKVENIGFRLICRKGYPDAAELASKVRQRAVQSHPDVEIEIINSAEKQNDYYRGLQYKVDIQVKGKKYEIGDGGFVDWTQQLLQNQKERMLSTGIGFDLMLRVLNGEL